MLLCASGFHIDMVHLVAFGLSAFFSYSFLIWVRILGERSLVSVQGGRRSSIKWAGRAEMQRKIGQEF
jgi:uncharacterized membrane protein